VEVEKKLENVGSKESVISHGSAILSPGTPRSRSQCGSKNALSQPLKSHVSVRSILVKSDRSRSSFGQTPESDFVASPNIYRALPRIPIKCAQNPSPLEIVVHRREQSEKVRVDLPNLPIYTPPRVVQRSSFAEAKRWKLKKRKNIE
jgi:hypothetical protein